MTGGKAYEVVRLEALAEHLLNEGTGARRLRPDHRAGIAGVHRRCCEEHRCVSGRPRPTAGPSRSRRPHCSARPPAALESDGRYRIADPVINAWLAWTAIKIGMPLQIHVGYGDADIDLLHADPLRLTPFLRATEERGVPVLLLHNYPFHRHAAYLAQVYSHVFIDVGLAVHNTGALSQTLIRETLELVPFGKLLFSSDAYGLAELYRLGAVLFRRGLSAVLDQLIKEGEMTSQDADHAASLIARDNARRVYGL